MDSGGDNQQDSEIMGMIDDEQEEIYAEDLIEVSEMPNDFDDEETDEMMESTSSDDASLVFQKHTSEKIYMFSFLKYNSFHFLCYFEIKLFIFVLQDQFFVAL